MVAVAGSLHVVRVGGRQSDAVRILRSGRRNPVGLDPAVWNAGCGAGSTLACQPRLPLEVGRLGRCERRGGFRQETQFHLWHLLLGVFLLSLAMAPARLVLPRGEAFPLSLDRELYFLLAGRRFLQRGRHGPLHLGIVLHRPTLIGVVFGWLFYCGVLTVVEYGFFTLFLGPADGTETLLMIYLLNVVQGETVLGTLLIFRACGFQLLRKSRGRQRAT